MLITVQEKGANNPDMYDSMSSSNKKQDFLLKRQAKAYAGSSSIHGLGYIAEDGRPIYEGY